MFLVVFNDMGRATLNMGSDVPLPYPAQIQRKSEKEKLLVFACLPSCHAGKFIYLAATDATLHRHHNSVTLAFQCELRIDGYPGILQASGARLGLLRLLASWTEQLLGTQILLCEATIVGLPRLYHVCDLITPL